MAFYIYRPVSREFLAEDEKSWTPDMFDAAVFYTRDFAGTIAERELGKGHDARVLDDGADD